MWLVLCEAEDADARWVYEGLRARGLSPLELVTSHDLAGAVRWVHQLDGSSARVEITLGDGRALDSQRVRGALNRLISPSSRHLTRMRSRDREYATQEWSALYLSWLYALPEPVINGATPQGLCGQWRRNSEWVWLAAQAGLPTCPLRLQWQPGAYPGSEWFTPLIPPGTVPRLVLVMDGRPLDDSLPSPVAQGCQRLAALAGLRLLGVDLAGTPVSPWTFAGAEVRPPLQEGGAALLDALANALAPADATNYSGYAS